MKPRKIDQIKTLYQDSGLFYDSFWRIGDPMHGIVWSRGFYDKVLVVRQFKYGTPHGVLISFDVKW